MASIDTTASQSPSSQSQVPAERVFQIDPSGLGAIAQSVNLFRGDVGVPVSIASLTSRSGVDASLALIYNSNLREQVDTWNLEAPTGPLGLGWSMGYEFIARDPAMTEKPVDGACYLVAAGSSNRLFRTAQTSTYWEYEAENYLFWRIRYFPATESWEVLQEDGTRRLYGGSAPDGGDSAIQYGIKWEGPAGNWTDATVLAAGQSRYAVAWNLASIVPPWGDAVRMEYENSEATIGDASGLAYTISSRLKRVVVPMLRCLVFHYLPKRHDDEVREYQQPHFDPDAPTLHAYQDRYETRFLASVEVRNADDAASAEGALIQRIGFEYALVNMARDHQGDPDYVKRYLVAVTYTTPEGLPLPDMRFDYCNDPAREMGSGVHRGALRSILYPQGGRVTFAYRATTLAGTERRIDLPSSGTPRVWFGPDYAVLVNDGGREKGLAVRVLSWNGQWVEAPSTYTLARDIDLATLQVSAQPEFFALACRTTGSNPEFLVLLFHKQLGRYGQWVTEQAFATLPVQNGDQALLATGTDFAVAVTSGPHVMAKVWDARKAAWADESAGFRIPANASYALAATAEYVALAAADRPLHRVDLQIWYRVHQGHGFAPARLDAGTLIGVDWQPDSTPRTFWSLGTCFAAMTYVTGGDDKTIHYTLKVLQWDEDFAVRTGFERALTVSADTRLPYAESIVSGSVLGNLGNLFRFDGRDWQAGTLPIPDDGGEPPRFVYGDDLAIATARDVAVLAAFDPYRPKWDGAVRIPTSQLGIVPQASGDWLSVDRNVYWRDPAGNLKPVHVLDSNLQPQSLVLRAPYFLAYEDQSGNTHVLPLANGAVDAAAAIVLPNQRMHVPDGGNGTSLVGPNALMTYEGSFESPTALKLYQFVNRRIEGPIDCYPVQSLAIEDGYPDDWGGVWAAASKCSRFYYDCDNVTVTPDGSVTEFAAATTVYGDREVGGSVAYPPPTATPFGRTEYRYHNNRLPHASGLVPREGMLDPSTSYYSFLDGLLFDETDYDADGVPVERTYNIYDVRREIASIDDPGTRLPIIGGYVKRPRTEISQYEQAIEVKARPDVVVRRDGTVGIPSTLARAFSARGYPFSPSAILVADRTGERWRLYPDAARPLFLPVTFHEERITASVPVTREVGAEYSWQTGLLSADSTGNFNSHGKHETVRREVYRAWEVPAYAELKAAHVWSPVAATVKLWQEDGMPGPAVPQAISVNTLARWPSGQWAPRRNFAAASESAYDPAARVPVRFTDWDNADPPPADVWRCSGEVTLRDAGGSALEALDAFGRPTATLLNRRGTGRMAEFRNATVAETLYAGFETCEDLARWQLDGQPLGDAVLVRGDAHTGMRSLALAPAPSSILSTALSLAGGKTYVLSCWVKTDPAFDGGPGTAQWSVLCAGQTLATADVAGSGGAWAYRHWPIRLDSGAPVRDVQLQLRNGKTGAHGALLLDDVLFAPLVGTAAASVYDERYGAEIAAVALNGSTTRNFFDSRRRPAAQTDAIGQVVDGGVTYLVREHDTGAGFRFAPADPNAVVSVRAMQGGAFADLVQGEGWRAQWQAADPSAWRVAEGVLTHAGSGTDAIAFLPSGDTLDFGFRCTVHLPLDAEGAPVPPAHPIGLDIGGDLAVRWTPGEGWRLTLGGTPHTVPAAAFAVDWALFAPVDPVTKTGSVHFYADGRLLFAQVGTGRVGGMASLMAGDPGIGFSDIALFPAPRLSAVFLDGSGKERQHQSFSGEGTIVSGSVYDAIGRAAIGVKPAPAPGRALAYDEDYVRGFDPTTGVMTGRAASAYPGDEGFPYVRTEFFRTAQSLAARQGAPGKALAITYTGQAGAFADGNPHVQQFSYGTNVEGQFGGDAWPSNQYFVKKVVDPDGVAGYTLTSQTDQTLATASSLGDGQFAVSQYFYDGSGRLVKMLPPAGVAARRAGDPDADQWATLHSYDFLGDGIELRDPDAGVQRTVFGPDSQLRFVAGEPDPDGLTTIRYVKYDAIGRDIEAGTVRAAWDREALQRIALKEPGWPGAAQNPVVDRTFDHDGDGTDPTLFGRVVRSTEYAPGGRGRVEHTFTYDASGLLVAQAQTATAFDGEARVVRYGYDAQGNLASVDYPAGCAIAQVRYAYDCMGAIFQVGTAQDPAAFASFTYNAAGQVERSVVRASAATELLAQARYGPPGWLERQATRTSAAKLLLEETLTYTDGGYQGAGYHDGKIASVQFSDAAGTQGFAYAYDAMSRLVTAQPTDQGQGAVDTSLAYDANGNIATLATGGSASTYGYAPRSDRVLTVTSGGAQVDAFEYNAAGAAVSALRRGLASITYNPATQLTDAITLAGGNRVDFFYDAADARTVKRVTDAGGAEVSARQYLRDRSGSPLLELNRTRGGGTGDVQYLYGPQGLIGMHANGKRYAVVRDHLGSVRQVVDDTGAVVARYDYTAFGATVTRAGSTEPDILYYRYTGQELDPETGLYNYQARFYDPELGRFVAVDPKRQGASPYVYVLNNPIGMVDPDGEEPLTAFLIALIVGAIVGAVVGGITYAVTHQGNFDVGKFFLYATVGLVAGAAAGAAAYAGGLMATAALGAAGVSTSTSIPSGIVVGASAGALDGAVGGTVNQAGLNLVEHRPLDEGLREAAGLGAGIGAAVGAAMGGITGAVNYRTATKLRNPTRVISDRPSGQAYANSKGAALYDHTQVQAAGTGTGDADVIAMVAHGGKNRTTLKFVDTANPTTGRGLQRQEVADVIADLQAGHADMGGIDLGRFCHGGTNGVARTFARELNVPVRTATGSSSYFMAPTKYFGRSLQPGEGYIKVLRSLRGVTYRTYYPNQLRTGWNFLFGY